MVTDAVHAHGAKNDLSAWPPWPSIWDQLGLEVTADRRQRHPVLGDARDAEAGGSRRHRGDLIQAHADTAVRAREGGYDGVEIHSAYGGYLVAQFLSPYSNRRDDELGQHLSSIGCGS